MRCRVYFVLVFGALFISPGAGAEETAYQIVEKAVANKGGEKAVARFTEHLYASKAIKYDNDREIQMSATRWITERKK